MLYNSDDNENKSNENKLFGADNANNNLEDSPAAESNPDSLFSSPLNGTKQNSSHDSLFDSSFSEDDIKANDTIDSSFVVSFNNSDPIKSVSDKLKYDNSYDGMDYEDDLADFDFDSSISAFKPLNAPVVDDPKPETPEVKAEEKIEEKVEEKVEEVKKDIDDELEEIDKPIFAPKAATASSAKDLDFAASESTKSSSSFSGNAPVEETKPFEPVTDNISDDIEEKVEEKSPFAPVKETPVEKAPEAVAPAAAAAVASSVADFASEPAKEELSPDQKAFESFKSSTKQAPKAAPQKDKLEGVQTYGKVSSGVDAFGKSTNAASVEQKAPVKRQANNVRPGAGKQDTSNSTAIKRPPRQGTSNSTPFGSSTERRIPPTQRKSAASQTGNIQPVTPVETKKRKSFGVGSIIAAIVLFLILVVVIIGLMFGSKITDYFKGISGTTSTTRRDRDDDDEEEESAVTSVISETKTDPTTETDETTEDTTEDTTTEATTTEETTTEATTTEETTTEATTEETTTEATTEETTTEATTTEETTTEATTSEETTAETTKKPSSGGGAVTTFYTSMSGFKSNDSGFTCNLVLENYGSKDAQLKDSVNSVKITFNSDKTITNVTSDYFTFVADPDKKNTFIATPTSVTIEAGEKFSAPITITTDGKPYHYGYTSCYFDWNK